MVASESNQKLRDQLAAEREKVAQLTKWLDEKRDESAMFAADATKYHQQLAAEREKVQQLEKELLEWKH